MLFFYQINLWFARHIHLLVKGMHKDFLKKLLSYTWKITTSKLSHWKLILCDSKNSFYMNHFISTALCLSSRKKKGRNLFYTSASHFFRIKISKWYLSYWYISCGIRSVFLESCVLAQAFFLKFKRVRRYLRAT